MPLIGAMTVVPFFTTTDVESMETVNVFEVYSAVGLLALRRSM